MNRLILVVLSILVKVQASSRYLQIARPLVLVPDQTWRSKPQRPTPAPQVTQVESDGTTNEPGTLGNDVIAEESASSPFVTFAGVAVGIVTVVLFVLIAKQRLAKKPKEQRAFSIDSYVSADQPRVSIV